MVRSVRVRALNQRFGQGWPLDGAASACGTQDADVRGRAPRASGDR